MSGIPALDSPAKSSLLGVLRSWLLVWPGEVWQSRKNSPNEADRTPTCSYGSARVLVVDDNPVNLMVISAMLESRGLVPVQAGDGGEAVVLACELHFDLILMDLQMPILDGLGATSAIRQFEARRSRPEVPVIAYSSSPPGVRTLAAHGLNGSLSKPCRDQELEDCLVQWCPTYRSAPPVRDVARDSSGWQPTRRNPGASGASLR